MARCYHRQCGRMFSGLTAFDRHLRMLKVEPWTACDDPSELALEERKGVWYLATPENPFATLRRERQNAGGDRG